MDTDEIAREDDCDGRLDHWSPCLNEYGLFVVGTITGDRKQRFDDGTLMTTSLIRGSASHLAEGKVITTRNSRYLLQRRASLPDVEAWLYAASLRATVFDGNNDPVTSMPVAEVVKRAAERGVTLEIKPLPRDGRAPALQ